jgi:hypothetical protein
MNERYQVKKEKPRAYRKMVETLFTDSPAIGLSDLAAWTPSFASDVLEQFASRRDLPTKRVAVPAREGMGNVIQFRPR